MASENQKTSPGGHYSGANPIPNIQKFVESLDADKKERDKKINEGLASGEIKDHVNTKAGISGTRKKVTDPTSGREVEIEDVNKDFMKAVKNPQLSVPNANLDKETHVKIDGTQSGEEYRVNQDITAPPDPLEPNTTSDVPIHGEKTNIPFHPTPSTSYEPMYEALETRTNILCAGLMIAIVVLGKFFGGALHRLVPLGLCISSGIYLWMKDLVKRGRAQEWSTEKTRGEMATANIIPESVEWMNTFLGVMWGLIDPDIFASVADTLEDVMQASVPGVVENVRVAEINQGNNPLRVLSLRALPDGHVSEMKNVIHQQNEKKKDPQELAADEEGGDYYNLECSFAYHAAPTGAETSEKAKNMHMQLVFYLGIKGLFGVPIPIFVELQGLVGTIRLRLQVSPEAPFLKAVTFTLMGLPKVQAGCVPLIDSGINILNLPLISKFVNYAIGAAANEYVAPKSMTLDMTKLLKGDDIQKDTEALGILWIRIHKATGLSKQDRHGSKGGGSDPYITVSFSKYGKPIYCTRVIQDDLNPIWEETCALLITPDLIKADEQLSMELWDSDRATADDVVGKVGLSMQKLIQHPSKMRITLGGWILRQFRPSLRSHGKNVSLPDELQDKKELQDEKGSLDTAVEEAVVNTPPDPLWPSGICSVIIHQIVNLELQSPKGSHGKRKGREFEPAQPSGENTDEEHKKLPSGYCTILFNDELVYRTRTKAVSSKPIFNTGTERFMRDWRSGIITVTHDSILGVVPLKLSDILQTSSQATRWYPLDGGIGFGRIRISLLFRSVETRLPPKQLGWDVGTFEFTSDRILATGFSTNSKLKMRTGGSSGKIGRTQCKGTEEGDGVYWDMLDEEGNNRVRLPVKYRYRSPVIFEFHSASKRGADAYAIIWLHHLEDNKEENISIPIWKTNKGMRLTQNYITEGNFRDIPDIKIKEVGRLQFRGRFKAGTDQDHSAFVTDNDSRETQETWEACNSDGSLTQGRDVLSQADKGEKQKWISKNGIDWSGAFGPDPARLAEQKVRQMERDANYNGTKESELDEDASEEEDDSSSYSETDGSDLGLHDATNHEEFKDEETNANVRFSGGIHQNFGTTATTVPPSNEESKTKVAGKGLLSRVKDPIQQIKNYKEDKQELHRKQKGIMQ
ncbi:hypothetical protein IFR05_006727 [Cadophora sp. M221]|nr:hypothetical protein IFR05_006727 [Cadophora sp. M221]